MARPGGPFVVPSPTALAVAEILAPPQWLGVSTRRTVFSNRSRAPPIPI
jgi:hypothetical protein